MKTRSLVAAFAAFLFIASNGTAQTSTWTGAVDSDWNDAGNWDNGVPNLVSEIAVVGAPSPTLSDINITIGGLTVSADGVLNLPANRQFNFDPGATIINSGEINLGAGGVDFQLANTVTNAGVITVDGSGSASDLELRTNTTLDGVGEVVLDGAGARINDSGGTLILTNGVDHTIRGEGNVGVNTINLVNDGLIVADVAAGTLFVDPNGNTGTLANSGTLRAIDGAVLALNGGVYNNAGGLIESAGGQVRINSNAQINGGTLAGADLVVSASANATFADLIVSGPVVVEDSANLITEGVITNSDTITMSSVSGATDIELQAPTTFAGSGTIVLDGPNARIRDTGGTQTLTIGADHTIRGRGDVGNNTINLINNGLIVADVAGESLQVDPNANNGTLTNNGVLRAIDDAVLALNGGVYNNSGGLIESAGGQLRINSNTQINGGTLTGADIAVSASATATFTDLTINGGVVAETGSTVITESAINNNGTITLAAGATTTEVALRAATTFSGTGTLVLDGPNARIGVTGGSHTLTNGAGHTIAGDGGFIGPSNTLSIVNDGVIVADGDSNGAPLVINPAGSATSSSFSGSGVIRAINGGDVFLEPAGYQFEDGLFEAIGPGSTIDRNTGVFNVFFGSFRAIDGGSVKIFDQGPDGALTFDGDLQGNFAGDIIELRGETSDTDIFNNTGLIPVGDDGDMAAGAPVSGPGSGNSNFFSINEGTFIIGDGYNFRTGSFVNSTFRNTGTILVESGSQFAGAGYTIQLIQDGPTNATSLERFINTGTLAGSGTVANTNTVFGFNINPLPIGVLQGDFIESDGVIAPGDSATETGTLTLHARDILLGDANDIQIDIGAGGADAVDFITENTAARNGIPEFVNTVELNGELSVNFLAGYTPEGGDSFAILTADDGFIGVFDTETLPTVGGGLSLSLDYGATEVTLLVEGITGDYNYDGTVDAADYTVWRDTLDSTSNLAADGDQNGIVDQADYGVWAANFGASIGSAVAVPEPSGVLLLLLGLTARGVAGRRR